MAANVAALLDKAKVIHRLPSDYKLALVMGVSHSALINYRTAKTLPDARVISLICDLTGDDPALLLAEVEAERAKTAEARALWLDVVQRLRSTLHAAFFAVVFGGSALVGFPQDAAASPLSVSSASHAIHRGRLRAWFARLFRLLSPAVWRYGRGFFPTFRHV